jgi:hypothetical protein
VHALNECIETQYGHGNAGFAALSPAVLQHALFSLAAPRAFANCECTDAGSNTATAEENPMLRHAPTLAHHCRPAANSGGYRVAMKFSGSSVRQQRPGAVPYGELARLALALALPLAGAIATMYYFGVNGSDANPAWQNKDGFSVPNDPSARPVSAICCVRTSGYRLKPRANKT